MTENNKPTVFISFNTESRDFVDSLERKLSKIAEVIRYEDGVRSWDSFSEFMKTISNQDFAVLVISDAYLKSYACMYEVLQAMKSSNWKEKVIVALMPDAKPYIDDKRIEYLEYWNEKYECTLKALDKLPPGSADYLADKLSKIKDILGYIDQFLSFVSDSNCPKIYNVIDEICERVNISSQSRFSYMNMNGEVLNLRQLLIIDYIKAHPLSTAYQIADAIGISVKSVNYHLKKLADSNKVIILKRGRVREYSIA